MKAGESYTLSSINIMVNRIRIIVC